VHKHKLCHGNRKESSNNPTSQVYDVLEPEKAAALTALYALRGSDITSSFARKGKSEFPEGISSCKWYNNGIFGTTTERSDSIFAATEEFVCKVYKPLTHIRKINRLRWWLFKKKQAE